MMASVGAMDWQEIVDSEERDADGNFLSLHTVTLNPEPR